MENKSSKYRWIRPEYLEFLKSGKKARTSDEIKKELNRPKEKVNQDGPSLGNYWG